jgi:hypothetical protein
VRHIKRDATKRERSIRRSREAAAIMAAIADQSGRGAYQEARQLEARYDARRETAMYAPRGRRG